ncbi:MAG: MazG nucleotide pyrophosphohydrolase domain-containing protein [Desulforhopalus sp.]
MTQNNISLLPLMSTIQSLRDDNGCPWDKRQTSNSLIPHLSSEAAELVSAIENNDLENTCEELGDLLYIIVMIAEIHRDLGNFDMSDVIRQVNEKLVRRHPHVFAGKTYENETQLAEQWELIKAAEKKKNTV